MGDASKLPLHDLNYYRDLALLWPFFLFAIAGALRGFNIGSPGDALLLKDTYSLG